MALRFVGRRGAAVLTAAFMFILLGGWLPSAHVEAQSGSPAQSLLNGPARMAYLAPAQAPLYASIRIDRDYRAALNDLIAIVSDALPELGLPSGVGVEDVLDLLTQELLNESFAQQEAWLGDYAAFAVQSLDMLFDDDRSNDAYIPAGLFVEVRSSASARAAAERALRNQNIAFTPQRLGSSTLYVPNNERDMFIVVVSNEALGVVSRGYFDYLRDTDQRPQPTLRGDQRFQNALANLPESNYNALIYVDSAQLTLATLPRWQAPHIEELATLQGTEPTLMGLTILPGNILTIDVVQPANMPTLFSALGVDISNPTPVTPAFVRFLPNNTLYAIHGANLSQSYRDVTNALGALADTATLGLLPTAQQIGERGLGLIAGVVSTVGLGLDFETDVLPALTSDFLVFVAPKTGTAPVPPPLEVPIDFGIVLANTDTGIAARVIERLYRAVPLTLQALGRPATFYLADGSFSLVYDDGRFTFEVIVTQTADFVFVGTVGAYQGVLNAQRTRDTNRFTTDAFPVLPGAALNGYMSNAGLGSLRPSVASLLRLSEQDFELIARLGRLFDVGVFSIKQADDYAIIRLTVGLTPASEQAALPPAPTPTIDFVATISAELTATAAAQVLRPTATPTETPTATPTETRIPPTSTFTPTPLPPLPTQPATGGLSTFVNNNSPRPFSIAYPSAWSTQGLPPFATDGGVTYIGNTVSAWLPLFGSELSTMERGDISMSISVEDIGSSTTLGARVILGVLLGNITGGENATAQTTTIAGRDSAFADLATGRRVVISIIDNTRIMLAFVYAPPGEMNAAFPIAAEVLGSVTIVR
jgi:hypothetical protein